MSYTSSLIHQEGPNQKMQEKLVIKEETYKEAIG